MNKLNTRIVFTPEQMAALNKRFANVQKEHERERQQRTEPVDIVVGTHEGSSCGGFIHYRSSFEYTGDVSTLKIGGNVPLSEIAECSCARCGVLFSTTFKPYRDQVIAHRNRKPG
jgi:hypothetical protein